MKNWQKVEDFLIEFIEKNLKKTGLQSIVFGFSGGLDSAVVAVLAKKALCKIKKPNNLLALMLPTQKSSQIHLAHAKNLCKKFDIAYEIIYIDDILNAYFHDKMIGFFDINNLRYGNFSSRVRMSILYDISALKNAVVIGTTNKSELALGYGTIYGDLASAFNPIGDLYKSEIFDFAYHLKIDEEIILKKPTADLWENQSDEDELGFSYKQIDLVLKDFLDDNLSEGELLKKHDQNLVKMVLRRHRQSAFKRSLPLIAKFHDKMA